MSHHVFKGDVFRADHTLVVLMGRSIWTTEGQLGPSKMSVEGMQLVGCCWKPEPP